MENSTMKLFALCALALLTISGMAFAYSSYDQPCTSDGNCWSPLKCDVAAGKCTQPSGVCTNMPAAWTAPLPSLTGGNNSGGPAQYISMLENGTWVLKNESSGTGVYQAGWFSDWQLLSLIGVAIAISVIAIAAMVGHAFNLPEVKAFVDAEMMQAVISVLLVASLIGLVTFFDGVARLAVHGGDLPVACNANEPCYISAAKQYLDNTYDAANAAAKDSLKKSFDNQALATTGYSMQFNLWELAFAGTSWRYNAGWSIEAERGSAVFETLGTLMAGIYAQKYFIDLILFGIAPVFMLLGVLLRTFFFTRKLGGLLLAIAIALFIVYPLTFAFAWYTLNVTVYGDRVLSSSDSSCPAECTATYPAAFYVNSSGSLVQFRTTQELLRAGINKLNWASGGPDLNNDRVGDYPGLVACRDLSKATDITVGPGDPTWGNCENCPDYCREVPFPSSLPGCSVAQCSACNAGCKIMRQRVVQGSQTYGCSPADCSLATCPSECKLQLPVESKCYNPEGTTGGTPVPANLAATCTGCIGCPSWCMVLYDNGTSKVLMNKNEKPCQVAACQPTSQGGSCPDTCMYISDMPSTSTNCDDICKDSDGNVCPKYCRVTGSPNALHYDTTDILPSECTGSGAYAAACANCKSICEINLTATDQSSDYLASCAPFPKKFGTAYDCASCPDYCRFQQFTNYSTYGSNTQLMAGTGSSAVVPQVCSQLAVPGFDCEPGSCDETICGAPNTQVLCREYNPSSSLGGYCTLCPDNVRVNLSYTDFSGRTTTGYAPLIPPLTCDDANCSVACKAVSPSNPSPTFNLPGPASGSCQDYNASYPATPIKCELCRPFCRINGMDESLRNESCNSATLNRVLSCGLESGDSCTSANFANGVCCGQNLQCNPKPATATNSTLILLAGAAPSANEENAMGLSLSSSYAKGSGIVRLLGLKCGGGTSSCSYFEDGSNYSKCSASAPPGCTNSCFGLDCACIGTFNCSDIDDKDTCTSVDCTWTPPPPTCSRDLGMSCTPGAAAPACCSAGACNSTTKTCCLGLNGDCDLATDCCSGICTGNRCATGCSLDLGVTCTPGAAAPACCSAGACNSTTKTCCLGLNGACSLSTDCCSGFCTDGNCSAPPCALGVGVTCTPGATGPACCSAGICNSTTKMCCLENDVVCNLPADCCSGFCNHGKCAQCLGINSMCALPTDCCSGFCADGMCAPSAGIKRTREYSIDLGPNYYTGARYTWDISFTAELDPSEKVTWQSGGYNGLVSDGGTGFDSSHLSNPMVVTVTSNGTNSEITDVTISYYVNQPSPVCTACLITLSRGDSCGNNDAGCCGPGLVCDSTTSTCQYKTENITPCSNQAIGPMGTTYCPSTCQYRASPGVICSEYVGAGPGASPTDTPINNRASPYDDRSSCRQCPENCRIHYRDGTDYTGNCGVPGNDNAAGAKNIFVDCSLGSCPAACRQTIQKPNDGTLCGLDQLSQKPGAGCSALCRRSSDLASQIPTDEMSGETSGYCPSLYCGPFDDTTGFGLTDGCLLPDSPTVACEGCLGCPNDCLYTPPVRTDCSDVCSDEALAGPVDIGPTDFIQKLPGAQGESDVKNAGTLMIPALVLPLFCLVMVVAFIRVLSPILGGDMEIPGLGRII